MNTSRTSRFLAAATFAAVTSGLMLAPLPATAASGVSQGGGIKCYWVLVSSINGTNTYNRVCRGKGA